MCLNVLAKTKFEYMGKLLNITATLQVLAMFTAPLYTSSSGKIETYFTSLSYLD